jgi:hypothetical protein
MAAPLQSRAQLLVLDTFDHAAFGLHALAHVRSLSLSREGPGFSKCVIPPASPPLGGHGGEAAAGARRGGGAVAHRGARAADPVPNELPLRAGPVCTQHLPLAPVRRAGDSPMSTELALTQFRMSYHSGLDLSALNTYRWHPYAEQVIHPCPRN